MLNRRKYMRLAREYPIEYGPVSALFSQGPLTASRAKNVSGSGVLFSAVEQLIIGSTIMVSIHIHGWMLEDGAQVPTTDQNAVLQLNVIAEVVRVEYDPATGAYRTGARFVGRVH